jgi:hypothetical protein
MLRGGNARLFGMPIADHYLDRQNKPVETHGPTVVGLAFLGETLAGQIARKSNMLRITVTESASEQQWILQGLLTGSSIEEFTTSWCVRIGAV